MPLGRCAGCGLTAAATRVKHHVRICPEFLTLFQTARQRCLDPISEHSRFTTEEDTPECRSQRRNNRLAERFIELQELTSRQIARWRTPADIFAK